MTRKDKILKSWKQNTRAMAEQTLLRDTVMGYGYFTIMNGKVLVIWTSIFENAVEHQIKYLEGAADHDAE